MQDNLGTKRLAGGTYAMQLKVLGKPYILLNPFHAYQLVPYTTSGTFVIYYSFILLMNLQVTVSLLLRVCQSFLGKFLEFCC